MTPITYKLDAEAPASTTYYPQAEAFTDEVLERAEETITPLARSYRRYLIEYELEDPRTVEEYAFELLNLGVLWRRYGSTALAVEMAPFRLLAFLSEWRKKHQHIKPAIDIVRGVLMAFFLTPIEPRRTEATPCCLADLEYLVRWLEATGDFREDAIRFVRWLVFFSTLEPADFRTQMNVVVQFADWFESAGAGRMGAFTPNVDSFVRENAARYRWREDRFACLRSRVEYHLNMVGAEIMNRAFLNEYARSEKKTVLLPGCMRLRSAEECEGTTTPKGIRCAGCEARCRVNQIRMLGDRQGFDVMIIPHSSDLSLWSTKPGEPAQGVVASACLSVLVQGGWELKRYGVPAQCVLLNECGCSKHWHSEGFPTQIDVRELKRLVQPGCRTESVRQALIA
ncbi:MAG: DUF116 domain-containing protein [Ignavibacteriae bacterium]|nr:DUF116 domain-containing protein [Ignavibacteriota bacterium]